MDRPTFFTLAAVLTLVAPRAIAKTIITPFGAADSSCAHEVPKGAGVDLSTGDVITSGSTVGHLDSCQDSWKLNFPEKRDSNADSGTVVPTTNNGWYLWSNAQSVGAPYDEFLESWYVPISPTPPSGSPVQFIWMGLQNNQSLSSNGSGCTAGTSVLIQPVLTWGNNGVSGSGAYWTIQPWVVWGCTAQCTKCSTYTPGSVRVYDGDVVRAAVQQIAASPDTWIVYIDDYTTGAVAYTYANNIPNSWPKFGSALGGVIENYGLNSVCSDISSSNGVTIYEDGVYEANPAWNSYYEVDYYGANLLTWNANQAPQIVPWCNWSVKASATETVLSWQFQ